MFVYAKHEKQSMDRVEMFTQHSISLNEYFYLLSILVAPTGTGNSMCIARLLSHREAWQSLASKYIKIKLNW